MLKPKNELVELEAKLEKSSARVLEFRKLIESQELAIANLGKAHGLVEARFTEGTATLEQLQISQAKIDQKIRNLGDIQRLAEAARNARNELEKQIIVKKQELEIEQRDFCIKRRDEIFKEIQSDTKLRDKLLEAMAAQASAPCLEYTFSLKNFVQKQLDKILPDIAEAEARTAAEKFIKDNDLQE